MPTLTPDEQKNAMKQALKEWLDEAFAEFGKWTLKGIMVLAFAGVVFLALKGQGWSK